MSEWKRTKAGYIGLPKYTTISGELTVDMNRPEMGTRTKNAMINAIGTGVLPYITGAAFQRMSLLAGLHELPMMYCNTKGCLRMLISEHFTHEARTEIELRLNLLLQSKGKGTVLQYEMKDSETLVPYVCFYSGAYGVQSRELMPSLTEYMTSVMHDEERELRARLKQLVEGDSTFTIDIQTGALSYGRT